MKTRWGSINMIHRESKKLIVGGVN